MDNKEKTLMLLDQIIERAVWEDEIHKARAIKNNKASQTSGESWMVFHLRALKELIECK
jgi:hypothetical protein